MPIPAELDSRYLELTRQKKDLEALIARSRSIIAASSSIASSEEEDDDEDNSMNSKNCLEDVASGQIESTSTQMPGRRGLTSSPVPMSAPQITTSAISSLGSDGEVSDDDDLDTSDHISDAVDCLMDLLPTIEQSLMYLESTSIHSTAPVRTPFSISEPARPWVQNISDKFEHADSALVERLGESNWQRFETVRARMNQIVQTMDSEAGEDVKTGMVMNTAATVVFEKPPQSLFIPVSLFYDSGLGSSVPTVSRYAVSNVSHTSSFASSLANDSLSSVRVPPTPEAVSLGKSFQCEICGHYLFNIKNRVDWKCVPHERLLDHPNADISQDSRICRSSTLHLYLYVLRKRTCQVSDTEDVGRPRVRYTSGFLFLEMSGMSRML